MKAAAPIPVQVLTRAQAAESEAFAVPDAQRWAVISDALLDAAAQAQHVDRHALVGCACCAGQLALRVTLGRLIRRGGYARILVVVADPTHQSAARELIGEAQFAPHLALLPD